MEIKLDLYTPVEWDAFGDFCKRVAQEKNNKPKDVVTSGCVGPINPASLQDHIEAGASPFATAAAGSAAPTTSATADPGTTAEAAAPAEPEKPKRTRTTKPKAEKEAEAKQDAADEAQEAAEKTDGAPLTHDSVRAELAKYVQAYGMAAAQEDGPKVIGLLFEGKTKVSDIPDTQGDLAAVIAGVREMLEKNPFKRTPVQAGA